ncbi:MAG: squalene/phytoene synthase family protein, partial [Bdellovibrionia bacterium]
MESQLESFDLKALEAISQEILKKGSKSFYFASRFFGKRIQLGAVLLYSWCRFCDDLIDQASDPQQAQTRLQFLFQKTKALDPSNQQEDQRFDPVQMDVPWGNDSLPWMAIS